MSYQKEAIEAGATHYGAKGHGWRMCPINQSWQVYKCGKGWVFASPETQPLPLVAAFKPQPDVWERVKRCMDVHEANATLGTLYDLREAIDRYDAEVCL